MHYLNNACTLVTLEDVLYICIQVGDSQSYCNVANYPMAVTMYYYVNWLCSIIVIV